MPFGVPWPGERKHREMPGEEVGWEGTERERKIQLQYRGREEYQIQGKLERDDKRSLRLVPEKKDTR